MVIIIGYNFESMQSVGKSDFFYLVTRRYEAKRGNKGENPRKAICPFGGLPFLGKGKILPV